MTVKITGYGIGGMKNEFINEWDKNKEGKNKKGKTRERAEIFE